MMFVLGIVLYGTTVLLPLFLQELMGYTAELSGMVLSPGGFAMLVMMPLVGTLAGKIEARWLAGVGFAISAAALLYMSGLNLQIDFRTAVMYRVYQSIGLAFLFIPINTAAFASATGENSNQISSIVNLCRNIGGSVGISLVTTLIARRSQIHQDGLAQHVTNYDGMLRGLRGGLSSSLSRAGVSAPECGAPGTGPHLWNGSATSGKPGLHRYAVAARSPLPMHAPPGVADGQKRPTESVGRTLAARANKCRIG